MAKKGNNKKKTNLTEHNRRSGQNLPKPEVTRDSSKAGEVFMEGRSHEANIERARALAAENAEKDRAANQ